MRCPLLKGFYFLLNGFRPLDGSREILCFIAVLFLKVASFVGLLPVLAACHISFFVYLCRLIVTACTTSE